MAHPILREALAAILGAKRAETVVGPGDLYLTAALEQAAIAAFRQQRREDRHTRAVRLALDLAAAGRLTDDAPDFERVGAAAPGTKILLDLRSLKNMPPSGGDAVAEQFARLLIDAPAAGEITLVAQPQEIWSVAADEAEIVVTDEYDGSTMAFPPGTAPADALAQAWASPRSSWG